jgi:hypothetical protein
MTAHYPPRIRKRVGLDHIAPKGTVPDDNKPQISSIFGDGHEELLGHLSTALGIEGARFAAGLLHQIVTFCSNGGHFNKDRYTFIVASLVTGKPRNHVEAMLILQQATMHILYMKYARLQLDPANPVQAELNIGILAKIARIFQAECEALSRSREGPIVEEVAQGARQRAVEVRGRSMGSSQGANGARVPLGAGDPSLVTSKEGSVRPRLRARPVNNGK